MIMDTLTITILSSVGAIAVTIIGFFIGRTFKDIDEVKRQLMEEKERAKEEEGKLKGKVELLTQKMDSKIETIELKSSLAIESVNNKLENVFETVQKMSEQLNLLLEKSIK